MVRDQDFGWRRHREVALAWALTAVVVALVYAAMGGLGLLVPGPGSLTLAVLATVVVAAVIDPVQRRSERVVARLVHGSRQAPYDVLSGFAQQVQHAGTEELPRRMARLLAEGTAAEWAQVWVLVHGSLTLMATHPPGADDPPEEPTDDPVDDPTEDLTDDGALLGGADAARGLRSVTVGYQGKPLGVLRVRERPGRPLTPVEERLFAGLAAQAGLALHAARVRAELEARHAELVRQTAELQEARDRLVATQDEERRRLERDLHDGSQQQLVALQINLRLAQTLAGRKPERARRLLSDQVAAATEALETLASLSRGDRPPVLLAEGVVPALRVTADASPVPVTFTSCSTGRLDPEVEAALYFCGVEALQNAVKHAGAARIEVRLTVTADRVELAVADDGAGMASGARDGSGLGNLRERLAALGGTLRVATGCGQGTTVVAAVPLAAPAPVPAAVTAQR